MLVLAQVHVQSRSEVATEHGIGDIEFDRARIGHRRRQLRDDDVGLDRALLVHQEHAWCAGDRCGRNRLDRLAGDRGLPVTEMFFQQRGDFSQRGVADDHQRGAVRTYLFRVPGQHVFARQRGDVGFIAGTRRRDGIRMAGAIDHRRQHARHHAIGRGLFLADGGEPCGAHALDLARFQARTADHIAIQGDGLVEFFLQRRQAHVGRIDAGAGADGGAQRFSAVAQCDHVVVTGAFVQHAHREAGGADLAAAVGRESAREFHAHLHYGHVVALGQDDLDAVAEARALHRRQFQVGERVGNRHALAAVEVGGERLELLVHRRQGGWLAVAYRWQFDGRRHFTGADGQDVVALAQPLPGAAGNFFRRRRRDARQLVAEATGVAGVHGALGQCVRLSAEAADALDAAHEAGLEHGTSLVELDRGRTFLQQAGQFFVDRFFDTGRIHVFLDGRDDIEGTAEFGGIHRRADRIDQLVAEGQALVQSRAAAAAEHLREQLQALHVGRAVLRHVPGTHDAHLRNAVGHRVTRGGLARGDHRRLGLE